MKKFALLAVVAALSACGGGGGSDEKDCSATLWGDSVADHMPQQITGFDVTNKAINGTSAKGRMAEFLADPITTRFTIIQWGMNDLPTSTTAAEHAERIAKMTQHAQQRGSVVVLTGISGTVGYHDAKHVEFDNAVRDLASFVDWSKVPYERGEIPDGIHPVPSYELRLVGALVGHLQKLAPECK